MPTLTAKVKPTAGRSKLLDHLMIAICPRPLYSNSSQFDANIFDLCTSWTLDELLV